jgi:hypothetical protein
MSSQSYLVDPHDEETGDMLPMKKSRRTLTVNGACRFDSVDHLPVHCDPKSLQTVWLLFQAEVL